MSDDFDRDGLISLLQELNNDDDEKVLKAARALRGGMRASGRTWDDLLRDSNDESRSREETTEDIDDDDDDDESEDEPEDKKATTSVSMDNDEALKLIDKMLKKSNVSASMREELMGYKEDIADGEFEASDRQYLRALHARLSKSQ